jgi:hypothetical protein
VRILQNADLVYFLMLCKKKPAPRVSGSCSRPAVLRGSFSKASSSASRLNERIKSFPSRKSYFHDEVPSVAGGKNIAENYSEDVSIASDMVKEKV